jgi:hypothetical protein
MAPQLSLDGLHLVTSTSHPQLFANIAFKKDRSGTLDNARRSPRNPTAARRRGAGSVVGRSTLFARILGGSAPSAPPAPQRGNAASASLMDNGIALRGVGILHPIRFRAEHRDEVLFALHGGDHNGVRAYAPGCATSNFEGRLEPGRHPEARPPAIQAIRPPAQAGRAPFAVEESQ